MRSLSIRRVTLPPALDGAGDRLKSSLRGQRRPASSEGIVKPEQSAGHAAGVRRQAVLQRQERALGCQHVAEIGQSVAIAVFGKFERAPGRRTPGFQGLPAQIFLPAGRKGVAYFGGSLQHGFFIGGQQRLFAGALRPDVAAQGARVEERPTEDQGADRKSLRSGREKVS